MDQAEAPFSHHLQQHTKTCLCQNLAVRVWCFPCLGPSCLGSVTSARPHVALQLPEALQPPHLLISPPERSYRSSAAYLPGICLVAILPTLTIFLGDSFFSFPSPCVLPLSQISSCCHKFLQNIILHSYLLLLYKFLKS